MDKQSKVMKDFWRGGELFVWMTASGVAISLLMVAGMLILIMLNGLGQFWPAPLNQVLLKTQETVIGQKVGEEEIPRGYWTSIGVWLNFLLAFVALALAVHFVTSG